ncbi:S8 family peptidase, partial [Planobispora longispora]
MRLRRLLAGAIALAAASAALAAVPISASAAPDPAAPRIDPAVVSGVEAGKKVRVIVSVKDGQAVAPVAESAEAISAATRVLPDSGGKRFFVMETNRATLASLRGDERISSIWKDWLIAPAALASSTKVIGADRAHAAGATGKGQNVVILDTGIDRDHPAFTGRIIAEACFSHTLERESVRSLCPDGSDRQVGPGSANAETALCLSGGKNLCTHGSLVTGIAAGKKNAGGQVDGVAPDAGIIAIQIFTRFDSEEHCGEGKAPCVLSWGSSQIRAMDYVIELAKSHKIAAVNLSATLYGASRSPYDEYDESESCEVEPVSEEIIDLFKLGIPVVTAAGNSGKEGKIAVPACVRSAVAVGATDDSDAVASFSNRGILLDLFAPGVGITSSAPGGTQATASGTSLAAAHVTGAFALLKERVPEANGAELLKRLRDTGKPISYRNIGKTLTTPRIDLARALGLPAATPSPVPSPTVTPSATSTATPAPTHTQPGDGTGLDPLPVPDVCKRGKGGKALTAARWDVEFHESAGKLSDSTLRCYLSIVQNGSKVFPELTDAGSLGKAYKVLKPRTKSAKA